jgi:ankyrin repeat protein
VEILDEGNVNCCMPFVYTLPDLLFAYSGGAVARRRQHRQGSAVAFAGQTDIAALLIEKGANLNARSTDQNTPLHLALSGKHPEAAALLVGKGAEVNAKDKDGIRP